MYKTELVEDAFSNRHHSELAGIAGSAYQVVKLPLDVSVLLFNVAADVKRTICEPEHLELRTRQAEYIIRNPMSVSKEIIRQIPIQFSERLNNINKEFEAGNHYSANFEVGRLFADCTFVVRGAASLAKAGSQGIKIAYSSGSNTLKSAQDFLSIRKPQSPITIQFSMHLNCGFPIDSIKPRKLFKIVPHKQHIQFLEKRVGATPHGEHVDLASGSGGMHVYENFAKARATARMRANLGEDAVPFLQRKGPYKNVVYSGMQSKDGARGWRLDFDENNPQKGAHINWWIVPDPNGTKLSI